MRLSILDSYLLILPLKIGYDAYVLFREFDQGTF